MNNPKVTVVIPCYNYGRFLQRAVDSVLKQTYQDFEIIIVDDYSTDNTQEISTSFTDARIKYIRQSQNVGQSANRNTAFKLAKGEIVALLDADDWLNNQYLENVVPAFNDPSVGFVYVFIQGWDNGKTPVLANKFQSENGKITEKLFINNFIGTSFSFRRSLGKQGYKTDLSPKFNNLGCDWWFALEMSTKCNVVAIERPLYNYNFHSHQMSNDPQRRIIADRIVQEKFLHQYPGQISKKTQKQAKYWSLIREGYYQRSANYKWQACFSYLKACVVNPLSSLPYKGLVFTLIKG